MAAMTTTPPRLGRGPRKKAVTSRSIPSSHRYEDGDLRVITSGPTFAKLVAESFDQIRGSAAGNVGIMLRMLGALQERIASYERQN